MGLPRNHPESDLVVGAKFVFPGLARATASSGVDQCLKAG